VPYRGNGPLITDLLGGQIAAGIMPAGDIRPHLVSGKVRVVGLLGARRSPLLPDVPTFKEQGIDVDTGEGWMGMWAPAKTPQDQLVRMQNALRQVLAQPEVRDILTNKAAFSPDFRPAEEMDAQLRKDLAYWGPVIKASSFTPDQ
jgi:tripartite-type tricarboxylate transporter receptor subunit TctC